MPLKGYDFIIEFDKLIVNRSKHFTIIVMRDEKGIKSDVIPVVCGYT